MNELAEIIVAGIVKDFTGRRGLRQEWEAIDDGIREEILDTWRSIAEKAIEEAEDDHA